MSLKYKTDSEGSSQALETITQQLFAVYPELAGANQPEWKEILNHATVVDLPARRMLMGAGSECHSFMLLLEGTVRVFQIADDGREVTLYRTNPGHICLISLNSLIHNRPFKANAETETPIKALMLTAEDFQKAMQVSEQFRNLVLSSLMGSVCEMIDTFYDTAFQALDMRLACLLGRLFERNGTDTLNITHQELAQELGTSREVVSRLLKKMEREQHITMSRGQIRVGQNKALPGQA